MNFSGYDNQLILPNYAKNFEECDFLRVDGNT